MLYRILSVTGYIVAISSLFFCCAAINDLIHPENTETDAGVLVGLLIFFTATFAGSVYMLIKHSRARRKRGLEKTEREILKMIARKNGRITPEEIAVNSDMTIDEAKDHLERLCENGAGELQVTESGRLVYVFFGFLNPEEKKTAKSVLD